MLDDQPYQAVGINYFDGFNRRLVDTSDASYGERMALLGEYGIPFIRVPIMAWWPAQNALYTNEKSRYFEYLDDFIRHASANRIGLILDFFWSYFCVPDMVGEPVNAWGDSASQTHAFMRQFIADVVPRYRDSAWVWGWEYGNEINLKVDLPNAANHRPPVNTSLGTPETRTADDDLTRDEAIVALSEFARLVRIYDSERIISSGNAVPRQYSWHNTFEGTWTQDTRNQFEEIVVLDNPDPVNTFSIHVYPASDSLHYSDDIRSLYDLMGDVKTLGDQHAKPCIMLEFGVAATEPYSVQTSFMDIYRSAILDHGISLAAVWVYDFESQAGQWSIDEENERAWMLDWIVDLNNTIGIMQTNRPVAVRPSLPDLPGAFPSVYSINGRLVNPCLQSGDVPGVRVTKERMSTVGIR
jgi:hypothetical protein